jgi:hypothetical protein
MNGLWFEFICYGLFKVWNIVIILKIFLTFKKKFLKYIQRKNKFIITLWQEIENEKMLV